MKRPPFDTLPTPQPREEAVQATVRAATQAFRQREASRPLSQLEFLRQQAQFLHKRWWLLQGAVLVLLWWLLQSAGTAYEVQRAMGTLAPLFVVLVLPELWKNRSSGALEIECTAYYSLRQIYAARMVLFGLVDLALLTLFFSAALLAGQATQAKAALAAYDELELDTLGDRKTALFLIMSDTEDSMNFLIAMAYSQLFNLLCEKADDVYGGRLPVHVRCLIDEAANIGQIPRLEKLVATIRSREVSACLVLQAQSQLKAIYKDNADTIIGNMDATVFLGGKEPTTLKELAASLGKETIDTYNTGESRGRETSHSLNYQKLGKELMSQDELAVMDGGKCILQLRGVRPFLSEKFDITKHPNYKYLSDYDKKNAFDIERFLSARLKLRPDEQFAAYSIDLSGDEAAEETGG